MNFYIIRKIFIVALILLPVFSFHSCKKQAKCGCGKDVLFSYEGKLIEYSDISYTNNGATAIFTVYNGIAYDYYHFCNPTEIYPTYTALSNQKQIKLSGDVYWDCTYMMNSSNSSYYSYYKIYNIQVTGLKSSLYGK
jgi:hypothetical protein